MRASHLKFVEAIKNDLEVLREVVLAVVLPQKSADGEAKAINLLKEEALSKAESYKFRTSVGIEGIWKMVIGVLDLGAGPDLEMKNCLPRACAIHAVIIKTTCLRSAANVQLEVSEVLRLKFQFAQIVAKVIFLIVNNLDTDTILGTACLNENIGKISPEKGTLQYTGLSPVEIEKIVGNSFYFANNGETEQ